MITGSVYGTRLGNGVTARIHIFLNPKEVAMDGKEILHFDTNAMTWEGLDVKELKFAIPWIPLHEDP